MTSERTLKNWRREALMYRTKAGDGDPLDTLIKENVALRKQVVQMTQELLDLHLVRRAS